MLSILEKLQNGEITFKEAKQLAASLPSIASNYKIIRTYSAGVFAGYVEKNENKNVILLNARRLYYWSGAATLSQLCMEGVKNPNDCKFPQPVHRVELTEAIEKLDCTEAARKNIEAVPLWKA